MKKLILATISILLGTSMSAYALVAPVIPPKSETITCPQPSSFKIPNGSDTQSTQSSSIYWEMDIAGLTNGTVVTLTGSDSLTYSSINLGTNDSTELTCHGKLVVDKKSYDVTATSYDVQNCTITGPTSAKCEIPYAE